jgi:hypothetical protein
MSCDVIKSLILWERSKLIECSKKKRRRRTEQWSLQKDRRVLIGSLNSFVGLRYEYKKNGLICDLLRCDMCYTASRMESETKITFIVVGTDPENTAHLFTVCAYCYCEIRSLTV